MQFEGLVFGSGIASLVALLIAGYTVFRAATLALGLVLVVSLLHRRTRLTLRAALDALVRSARDSVALINAAACVGIVIGVVTLTGVGTRLPSAILELAQGNLFGALVLIMVSSLILGMGMPSAVCYLLLATLIGPVLGKLGVVPLAAHMFIFYFGMMSMVTPPVALAAYTAASIAGASIMRTSVLAFRFALVGFTLPYMFVFRPELLMLDDSGALAGAPAIALAVGHALLGIVPLAAGIAGYLFAPLVPARRVLLLLAAGLLLVPTRLVTGDDGIPWMDLAGAALLVPLGILNWRRRGLVAGRPRSH